MKVIKKLILVEGKDDQIFLTKFVNFISPSSELTIKQIASEAGVDGGNGGFESYRNFSATLLDFIKLLNSDDELIIKILIIRDADNNFNSCKESIKDSIKKIKEDERFKKYISGEIAYYIMPDNQQNGMLEDLIVSAIEGSFNEEYIETVAKPDFFEQFLGSEICEKASLVDLGALEQISITPKLSKKAILRQSHINCVKEYVKCLETKTEFNSLSKLKFFNYSYLLRKRIGVANFFENNDNIELQNKIFSSKNESLNKLKIELQKFLIDE